MKKTILFTFLLLLVSTSAFASFPVIETSNAVSDSLAMDPDWGLFFACWFLGFLGIHRFMMGDVGIGILQLLTLGGFGLWVLIDLIRIATGSLG